MRFTRDAKHPLDAGAVILDEASMVDVQLAASLLQALPDKARLVLVGDADQLPSVGPGAVLRDLIASQVVPTVRLTEIFRQAEASGIVKNAHRILRGELPESAGSGGSTGRLLPDRAARSGADRGADQRARGCSESRGASGSTRAATSRC